MVVLGPLGAAAHAAGNPDDVLIPHPVRLGKTVRGIRIEHHLGDAIPVPEVEEDNAAVVPAPMDPAAERYCLVNVGFVDSAAIVTAHTRWFLFA